MKLVVFRRVTPREALGRLLMVLALAAIGYAIWAPSVWAAAMGLMSLMAGFMTLVRRLNCESCGALNYTRDHPTTDTRCAKCGELVGPQPVGGVDGVAVLRLSVWLLLAVAVVLATWLSSQGHLMSAGLVMLAGLAGLLLTLRKMVCPQCGQVAIASSTRLRHCHRCGAPYPSPEH